jgi:phosphocarrier protein
MVERQVVIQNEKGLHVRPATAFMQLATKFASRVQVVKGGQTVNGKSSLELLMLAATPGTSLTIRAEGADAEQAVETLAKFVDDKFGMRDD